MENSKNKLREWGWVLIFFAIYDVFMFIIKNITDLASGEVIQTLSAVDPAIQAAVTGIVIAILVLWALAIVAQLFIGGRGLQISSSSNPTKSGSHIVIAKILGVLNVIMTIIVAVGLFTTKFDIENLLTLIISICDVIILFSYAKDAKIVRNAVLNA